MTDERALAPEVRRQAQNPDDQGDPAAVSVDDDYPDDESDPDGQLGADAPATSRGTSPHNRFNSNPSTLGQQPDPPVVRGPRMGGGRDHQKDTAAETTPAT